MTAPPDARRLEVLNAVLRVLVQHPNLLQRDAIEALAAAIASFVSFRRMGLVLPEGPEHRRIYRVFEERRYPSGFGSRLVPVTEIPRAFYVERRPYFVDDTRLGTELERQAAERGALSYVALSILAPGAERRVMGDLVLAFGEVEEARRAPIELLQEIACVVGMNLDHAERLARSRELEEQHRALLDNAPLIIFRLDPRTGELVYLNRHAERLLGVPTAEALGTPGFLRASHADPEGVACFDEAMARARSGGVPQPYEARLTRRGDDAITARGTIFPVLSEGGEIVTIEGVLADVSVEQAARTRLVQSDRLATLGTLAAGIAHEINNPAAFIVLGLNLLDRMLHGAGVALEPGAAASAGDLLHELRDSIRRIVDIARDLRLFAGPPSPEPGLRAIVDVNRTVESALGLMRGQILERAQIIRSLEEVPPVVMDDGRLGQVLVNLLANAAQAIPKAPARAQSITVSTRSDGHLVKIEVRDTGVGIPRESLGRIWQPFFTTKGPDLGIGLGLSISREIVERAGGEILVESPVPADAVPGEISAAALVVAAGAEAARGTRFVVLLPAAGAVEPLRPASSPVPRPPGAPLGRAERCPRAQVLIVEDEPALGRVLSEELGRFHDVEVASSAPAALSILERSSFDVVLCDLRMPGMSGEALYARVVERDEALGKRFIFMTGVGFGPDVERFIAAAGRPLLEKPFSAEAAAAAITKVVGKNRREPS